MTTSEKANGVCGSTGFQNHSHDTSNFTDFDAARLRYLGDQLSAFNRLEASALRFGINVYPLDGDSIYMTGAGGFHCCAPDIRAAAGVIRQFGAVHG